MRGDYGNTGEEDGYGNIHANMNTPLTVAHP